LNDSLKSYLLVILLSVMWGLNWTTLKISVTSTSPLFVAVVTVFLGAACFIPLCLKLNVRFLIRKHLWKYMLLGLFSTTLVHGFEFQAFRFISSSETAISFFIFPLVSVPLSAIFLKEKISLVKLIGVLIGFFGIFVISFPKLSYSGGFNTELFGIGFAMLGGSFWAVGSIYFKKNNFTSKGTSNYVTTMSQLFFGALFLTPIFFITENIPEIPLSYEFLSSFLYVIIFSKFVAMVIWYKLLDKGSVVNLSTSTYLIPVFATIFGVFLLGEVFTLYNLFGIMFVLIGIYLTIRKT